MENIWFILQWIPMTIHFTAAVLQHICDLKPGEPFKCGFTLGIRFRSIISLRFEANDAEH